jgi:glycosyltransferase involved in cell wall biosynthesis
VELAEGGMNHPSRILAVYYGVEMPKIKRSERETGPECSENANQTIVGAMARLVPQKGVDLLIRTVSSVSSEFPNVRYVIAGDGPMEQDLKALAKAEGVADRVEFAGYVDDCHAFLASLDVFVLPSRWEGLPLVVLLAGAVGTPVVSFDVGGVGEVIDGRTGWLVSGGDVDALTSTIIACLSNRNESQRRGELLSKAVHSTFRVERMASETYNAYCRATTAKHV